MTLDTFFRENPRAAIGFSGGVDSSFLLYAAMHYGAQVRAYYVKTAFQPEFELRDARHLAETLGADLKMIELDILQHESITSNPCDRCYYCKQQIFGAIQKAAAEDGFSLLLDGTNASDDVLDRPGMKALEELSVRSPLRECGLTKLEIRERAKEAGLFIWNKPAYACLATRIRTGEPIDAGKLAATEETEAYLMSLGFSNFRIRRTGNTAIIQVSPSQIGELFLHRSEVLNFMKAYYDTVTLDLEGRR